MATSHSLKAETRACGSGNLKQLRSQGLVPGVVYGPGFDNVNIQVDAREFARMLASAVSEHILVALDINGKIVKALLKEVQHNPITNACLHVDFQAVTDTTVIHSIVPVILEGEAAGVALGGVLDQTIHELAIVCQVKNLPEAITADISGLSCPEGEVDNSVFDRYLVPLYKQASFKPYIIAAMIFLAKVKDPQTTLKALEERGIARWFQK